MGIKHFFYWFKNHFGHHMNKINNNQTSINVSIDNLMVDMNGVFHDSAQKIYKYGNYKENQRLLGCNKKLTTLTNQLEVFKDVCKTIEHYFTLVKPNKRLILCVDGPAPLSKQNQQRQRRFRSAMESSSDMQFDSNCITPGTEFMNYMTKYIDWFIRKRINENPEWRKVDVIFSNEKAPGEGEHKIINFIRYYGNLSDSFCIVGLDADLIMLALGTHIPNFYILREDLYNTYNKYFLINVGEIHDELAEELRWKEDNYTFDKIHAVNDFIFLCFMVGNDFLPHIPSIEIISKGIELILEVYKETCSNYGHITCITDSGVQFCPKSLSIFLGTIGQYEKENFESKLSSKQPFFTDKILDNCIKQNVDGKWIVDINKYNTDYCNTCFPKNVSMEKICHEYLEGMQWVLSYYTRGVSNWKWNFQYHYAPPASVLAQYTENFKFPKYGRTIPSTPFQQLLCVLPPKSANLIPKPLCNLLTDESSPIRKYCPEKFHIDLSGKRKEWEGIVILPMVNFETVQQCYVKYLTSINDRDLKRNLLGSSFIYKYCNKAPYFTFKSYYGNIDNCYVKTYNIDL